MLEWFLGPRCPRCQKRRLAGREPICIECEGEEAAEVRERKFFHRVAALNVNTVCLGDTVSYRRGPSPTFNTPPREPNPTIIATVLGIDHCLREGDKYGNKVGAIGYRDRRYGFLKVQPQEIAHSRKNDTTFCYGTELIELMQVGPAAPREAISHDALKFNPPRHWKLRGYPDDGDAGAE